MTKLSVEITNRLVMLPTEISKSEASDWLLCVADLEKRLQQVERERDDLHNQRDDLRDSSESWKIEAETALQEVARLEQWRQDVASEMTLCRGSNPSFEELAASIKRIGEELDDYQHESSEMRQDNARLRSALQPFSGVYPWVLENLKGEDWARWERAAVECLGPDALKALEGAALAACEEKQ